MTLSQSLVEVITITSKRSRSQFGEQEIEQAAQLIVEAEGIINPIVVARTGINSFEVVNGHFEYYAAARAREIDLARAETIAAYIVEEENEAITKQIEIFRKPQSENTKVATADSNYSNNTVDNLQTRVNNLELRMENRFNELKSEYIQKTKELETEIESLKNKLPEQIEPLITFKQASLEELTIKLKPIYRSDKQANKIASNIVKARPFQSLNEVLTKTEELGEKNMLKIVDRWLYSQ
ncbi:MAG: hypothetical protein QNJ72_36400 [Pleurocapsa sp. MO_226.B13]|nr:hypothetical protein [Pleurocapsa sp. MO_226.B13]